MKTSTKTAALILTLLFCACHLAAQTYVVTNSNNIGPGSLRQAMYDACSTTALTVNINFNLPTCCRTITLDSAILTYYSNTAATKRININGTNASGQVTITGTGTRAVGGMWNYNTNINLYVYSLQFQNLSSAFYSSGYAVVGAVGSLANTFVNNNYGVGLSNGGYVVGNYIGTNASFATGLGNGTGIDCSGAADITVANNYICSNTTGIWSATYASSTITNIVSNIAGTNNTAGTRTDLGNTNFFVGYYISTIGSAGRGLAVDISHPYFRDNTIAYTSGICFEVYGPEVDISKNDFICNSGTFIKNANTAAPLYTAPTITSAIASSSTVTISGTSFSQDSIILFYRNPSVCPSSFCQGFGKKIGRK